MGQLCRRSWRSPSLPSDGGSSRCYKAAVPRLSYRHHVHISNLAVSASTYDVSQMQKSLLLFVCFLCVRSELHDRCVLYGLWWSAIIRPHRSHKCSKPCTINVRVWEFCPEKKRGDRGRNFRLPGPFKESWEHGVGLTSVEKTIPKLVQKTVRGTRWPWFCFLSRQLLP